MTIEALIYRRKPSNRTILAVLFALIVWQGAGALAQDMTITNLTQLAEAAFSADYSFYLPLTPCQWGAYSTDNGEPWWVDCSQVACTEFPLASTNLSAGPLTRGVQLIGVRLTKNIFTGETTLQWAGSTNVVAVIPAPNDYQVGSCPGNAWVLRQWQQVTNCPACWGLSAAAIPPPTVTLRAFLADLTEYPIYESNEVAQAKAAVAAVASRAPRGSDFEPLDDEGSPCAITNDAAPYSILSISQDTNHWTTITWQSCTDHIYAVYSTGMLTTQTTWSFMASMFGQNGQTSWTDETTPGVSNRFYRVERLTLDGDAVGDGIPNWWRQQYYGDAVTTNNQSCASCDPDGDCFNNLQDYADGVSPLHSGLPMTLNTVYAGPATNAASLPTDLITLYDFTGEPPLGVVQGSGTDTNFYGAHDANTLFKMSPQGTFSTVYQFTGGANGYYASMPVLGSDGNFYGVCELGGLVVTSVCNSTEVGYGTVYRVTPQGVQTNLHLFAGPPEGSCPVGGLIQGSDGNFYGVTAVGGSNNCPSSYCCDNGYGGYGTVFKVTPQGTLTTLHIFNGGSDGAIPEAALLQARDGLLYGTTSAGSSNAGTVFKVSTNGNTFTVLHAFGGDDGATPLGTLIQDGNGSIFGTTYGGGSYGAGAVFGVTTNGAFTLVYNFTGQVDGADPGAGLMQGSGESLYGTTVNGGVGQGSVFEVTPQGTLTTLGVFGGGVAGAYPDNGALVQGWDGDLYGTTLSGGTNGGGTFFKCPPVPQIYTWSITGGTILSGQGTPYITFTASSVCPVTFDVAVTNSTGCSNSGSATVVPVVPAPSANSPLTLGQTLNLSAVTVPGAAYNWTGPNGFSTTNQNAAISNAQSCAAGQYCVTLTGNGCTSAESCVSVTVNPLQPGNNGPLCAGQTLNLSISNVTGATYSWTGPNGFHSNSQNPSIANVTTNASGTYCVAVTVNGCISTNCGPVTIYPLTAAVLTGDGGTNCMGTPINLQATLTGTSPWIVTWSDGFLQSNVTANPDIYTVSPYSNVTYTVAAISDANCTGTTSGSVLIAVTTNRTTSVVVSNEVLVVYNTNWPDSVTCANYYISHRPGFSNVNVLACSCTTTGTDGFESITTANLTNQIINPIINFMLSNTNKAIHYVVLMYGMPSRISDAPNPCEYYPIPGGFCTPAVQNSISRCMSDAGYTSGPYYEGSTCPFVATNFLGTTCLVTSLNLATLADCEAYINKVAGMYSGNVIISASSAGYKNTNYYIGGGDSALQHALVALGSNGDALATSIDLITNGTDVAGYGSGGKYTYDGDPYYPVDGTVVWSGSSQWWIISTGESYNGQRDAATIQGQGDVEEWFSANAWGGTNYTNTPVGAVSEVEEPGINGLNGPTYYSLWEENYLFIECAWASKNTPSFQAVGDPLIRK